MKKENEIKLSSSWTIPSMILMVITSLIFVPVIFLMQQKQEISFWIILGDLLLIALVGFVFYLLFNVCIARIINDKLILRKLFKSKKEFSFNQIQKVSSFRLKRSKYIFVKIKHDSSHSETFVILNSSSILSFEDMDAEEILNSFRKKK